MLSVMMIDESDFIISPIIWFPRSPLTCPDINLTEYMNKTGSSCGVKVTK